MQQTSLQYLFLSVLVHVPFIKTLVPEGKIPFSVNNQVCSPRPPARLSGARGLQTPELALGTGLVGSDGGLCVFKSLLETRGLSSQPLTSAPLRATPSRPRGPRGPHGPRGGAQRARRGPWRLASGFLTAYGLRHLCKTHSSGEKKIWAKFYLES